jgi:hypothetical protein
MRTLSRTAGSIALLMTREVKRARKRERSANGWKAPLKPRPEAERQSDDSRVIADGEAILDGTEAQHGR